MKITQIGRTTPRLIGTVTNSLGIGGISYGSNLSGAVQAGYALTAQSSNTAIFAPNVGTITANSSNAVQGPIVNFTAAGSIGVTASSNTITISGGSSAIAAGTYVLAKEGGQEVLQTLGNLGSTETINLANANSFAGTLNANCTFTFTGALSGTEVSFTLELTEDGTGGYTPTWPGSVVWPGGSAPSHTTTAGSVTIYVFRTRDGGTTWYGFKAGSGGEIAHSSNTLTGTVTISHDSTLAMTTPAAATLHMSAPYLNEVVTNGEDVLVWHGADLVHERVRLY